MFENASDKLNDARIALERLQSLVTQPVVSNIQIISGPQRSAGDAEGTLNPVAYAEAFSSCLAQIRAIGDAIIKNKNANTLPGFGSWRDSKKTECQNDSLLRFINEARNADLHEGRCPLLFTMHPFSFESDRVGPAPSTNAVLVIDGRGPQWIIDRGTPNERRSPVEPNGIIYYTVAISNPPVIHLQNPLSSTTPTAILHQAESYYSRLLYEARSTFAP